MWEFQRGCCQMQWIQKTWSNLTQEPIFQQQINDLEEQVEELKNEVSFKNIRKLYMQKKLRKCTNFTLIDSNKT